MSRPRYPARVGSGAPAGRLEIAPGARRYPGRYEVVDATWVTASGEGIPAVAKRTPTGPFDALSGGKAERAWRVAAALGRRGIPTPEPLGVVRDGGSAWYVARRLDDARQIRDWLWPRTDPARPAAPESPRLEEVLRNLGRLARDLHDAGVFFRDLSDGNVLVDRSGGLWLVDLSRARLGSRPLRPWARVRDLARPGVDRSDDRKVMLESYFGGPVPAFARRGVGALRRAIVLWDDAKRFLRPWRR